MSAVIKEDEYGDRNIVNDEHRSKHLFEEMDPVKLDICDLADFLSHLPQ